MKRVTVDGSRDGFAEALDRVAADREVVIRRPGRTPGRPRAAGRLRGAERDRPPTSLTGQLAPPARRDGTAGRSSERRRFGVDGHERAPGGRSGVVGVAAVDDRDDLDDEVLVDDPVDHAVLTATGRVERREWLAQRPADPVGVLTERSHDELEGCGCDLLGEVAPQGHDGPTG